MLRSRRRWRFGRAPRVTASRATAITRSVVSTWTAIDQVPAPSNAAVIPAAAPSTPPLMSALPIAVNASPRC